MTQKEKALKKYLELKESIEEMEIQLERKKMLMKEYEEIIFGITGLCVLDLGEEHREKQIEEEEKMFEIYDNEIML